MNVGQSANKQEVLSELLGLGMVLVALDARRAGVDVPAHLAHDAQLRLNLSYRFGLPMAIEPWGIAATLTFGGVPHACKLPWQAIFLLVSHINGEPYLFPDEVPHELLQKGGTPLGWRLREALVAPPQRPSLTLLTSLGPGEQVRATLAPRGRKKGGARRASGGFAAAARRLEQEQARADEKSRPADQTPPTEPGVGDAALPPPGGPSNARSRAHLRVVK